MARDKSTLSNLILAKFTAAGLFEPTSGQTKKMADALADAICLYLDSSVDSLYNGHTHICNVPPAASATPLPPLGTL